MSESDKHFAWSDRGVIGGMVPDLHRLTFSSYPSTQLRRHILSFFSVETDMYFPARREEGSDLGYAFRCALISLNNAVSTNSLVSREVQKIQNLAKDIATIILKAAEVNKEPTENLIKVVVATLNLVTMNAFPNEYSELTKVIASRPSKTMKALSKLMKDLDRATKLLSLGDRATLQDDRSNLTLQRPMHTRLTSPLDFLSDSFNNSERGMCSSAMNALASTLYCTQSPPAVIQSAEKLLDGLFTKYISNQDKQSMIDLRDISIATINYMNGHTSHEEYKELANKMLRHSSLTTRVLGGLMMALGATMMALGVVIGVGLAAPVVGATAVGVGVATAGLALVSAGVTFFTKKSANRELVESIRELSDAAHELSVIDEEPPSPSSCPV